MTEQDRQISAMAERLSAFQEKIVSFDQRLDRTEAAIEKLTSKVDDLIIAISEQASDARHLKTIFEGFEKICEERFRNSPSKLDLREELERFAEKSYSKRGQSITVWISVLSLITSACLVAFTIYKG